LMLKLAIFIGVRYFEPQGDVGWVPRALVSSRGGEAVISDVSLALRSEANRTELHSTGVTRGSPPVREIDRRTFLKISVGVAGSVVASSNTSAALVPPYLMFCVVALGGPVPEIRDNSLLGYRWSAVGTGFFYGHLAKPENDPTKRAYNVYLVTAKHVVDGWNTLQATIGSRGLASSEYPLNPGWTSDPHGKDISVLSVNVVELQRDFSVSFFASDVAAADRGKLRELGVAAGDGTFVLGFPMGLVENAHSAVIVRECVIARIEDLLSYEAESFMIDSFVFPGNSGGSVVLKPENLSIQGTKNHPDPYLIGVVDAYQPYREPAVSLQTQETRIIFEENSGLANILPIDYVNDAIVADSIVTEGIQRRSKAFISP
jgi:S1-C subfamily serine protease